MVSVPRPVLTELLICRSHMRFTQAIRMDCGPLLAHTDTISFESLSHLAGALFALHGADSELPRFTAVSQHWLAVALPCYGSCVTSVGIEEVVASGILGLIRNPPRQQGEHSLLFMHHDLQTRAFLEGLVYSSVFRSKRCCPRPTPPSPLSSYLSVVENA